MYTNIHKKGATLIEMIAAVLIISIVIVGVLQFLLISRLNIYTSNIRTGIIQLLSDTIVQYQYIPAGSSTNITVTGELGQYISSSQPYIKIEKTSALTNGTYTITGTLNWQTFRDGDGTLFTYTEELSLHIPQ